MCTCTLLSFSAAEVGLSESCKQGFPFLEDRLYQRTLPSDAMIVTSLGSSLFKQRSWEINRQKKVFINDNGPIASETQHIICWYMVGLLHTNKWINTIKERPFTDCSIIVGEQVSLSVDLIIRCINQTSSKHLTHVLTPGHICRLCFVYSLAKIRVRDVTNEVNHFHLKFLGLWSTLDIINLEFGIWLWSSWWGLEH